MVLPASHLRGADRHGESVGGHEAVGDCPYHRAEMRITYLFLPLYFGLLAGLVGHSVRAGLVGAAVGLILAVLLSAEGNRRGRTDGMAAIDAMTGTEFEDYVAARLQRAGWRVQFTPASGDYGVDLIGAKDGKSVAVSRRFSRWWPVPATTDAPGASSSAIRNSRVRPNNWPTPTTVN
jgi:hypothetical protein